MLLAMITAGCCLGAGLVLMARGLVGHTAPLDAIVTELHRPRVQVATQRNSSSLIGSMVGRPSKARDRDLAVCERTPDRYVQDRLTWAAIWASPGAALLMWATLGGGSSVPAVVVVLGVPAGAVAGWLYARVDLRSDAVKARREFRHALAAYLELVTILIAGGAGVETAMFDAVAIGKGGPFRHLRTALSAAQAHRDPPWHLLGELGDRLGVNELTELYASMALAGGGAQVRDTLAARATWIRTRDVLELEAEAQARSETMVLPVALMFAGFLVLIGYPALSALSTP